ncbi:hypothetical protein O181_012967 [Austropuccinia psidii MF-1]|uniref:Uncharacterized protein n=1 Tax=Austropuccinia psidii MF-1 TaxID=1389203 RepID=A0A9Q3BYQ0_9BASI|nr:hypothetical protein [Austropuccinia psidii MF-1]
MPDSKKANEARVRYMTTTQSMVPSAQTNAIKAAQTGKAKEPLAKGEVGNGSVFELSYSFGTTDDLKLQRVYEPCCPTGPTCDKRHQHVHRIFDSDLSCVEACLTLASYHLQ